MTTSLDECVFYLRHLQRRPSVEELSEMETKKKKSLKSPAMLMDRTRHGQHWLTALPTPFTESLLDRNSLHLGILHKLVRICRMGHSCIYTQAKRTFQIT